MSLLDLYSQPPQSIFDTRNVTDESNNMLKSIYAEFNIRESKTGQVNVLDKMRGLQGARLDNSGEVSLAEQLIDSRLDKRTFNGVYNVTISDVYKNKNLMNQHFNLYSDGMVEDVEHSELEGDFNKHRQFKMHTNNKLMESDDKQPEKVKTSPDFRNYSDRKEDFSMRNKKVSFREQRGSFSDKKVSFKNQKTSFSQQRSESIMKNSDGIISVPKGNIGIFGNEKELSKLESIKKISEIKKKKRDEDELYEDEDEFKMEYVGKNGFVNDQVFNRVKEINSKFGKNTVTEEDLINMDNGGEVPLCLRNYSEIQNVRDEIQEKILISLESERATLLSELKKVKAILTKKIIAGL